MKFGLISDTHDCVERTEDAVALLKQAGADVLFHCGDLTTANIVEVCAELPFYFVFGNCDFDNASFLKQAAKSCGATCLETGGVVELAGKRIALTHGHLTQKLQALLDDRPDVLLTGHSHLKMDRTEGSTRRINPGALHRAHEYTVALLDLETDNLQFLVVPG